MQICNGALMIFLQHCWAPAGGKKYPADGLQTHTWLQRHLQYVSTYTHLTAFKLIVDVFILTNMPFNIYSSDCLQTHVIM